MSKRVRKTLDSGGETAERLFSSRLISTTIKRNDVSRQVDYRSPLDDVDIGSAGILAPPYAPSNISRVVEHSNILPQCIDAMVANIAMYGYEVAPADGHTEKTMDPREITYLQSFITAADTVRGLAAVSEETVRDYEKFGYCFYEVIRNVSSEVSMIKHAPAYHTRLTPRGAELVPTTSVLRRGDRDISIKTAQRFRTFMQESGGGKRVYFKEFGDPRQMDYRTGEFKSTVPAKYRATEILHHKQASDDPYGVPRWISQLPGIMGSRESEMVNLRYFEDNTIPPMIMSVAGGRLTGQSFRNLEKLLQAEGVGKDRQHKILLIEAIAESIDLDGSSNVSLRIDKLADARQSDSLFSEYDEANRNKVRSAFRLPPVLIGNAQETNYANAQASTFIAEMQVFLPERSKHDAFLNGHVVNNPLGIGLKTVKLRSKAPPLTNPEKLVQAFTAFNVMGAISPRDAVDLFNEVTQTKLPQYPEEGEDGYEPWMDEPSVLLKSAKTHNEQSMKDEDVKEIEKDGDIETKQPEHGSE